MTDRNNNHFNSRRDRTWGRNQNTVAFEPAAKLGPISHTVLVAMMVAVLGLIYLTQITKTSTYSYQIDKLNEQRSKLVDRKSELEVETARLKSLQKVQSSQVAAKLTTPKETNYIR